MSAPAGVLHCLPVSSPAHICVRPCMGPHCVSHRRPSTAHVSVRLLQAPCTVSLCHFLHASCTFCLCQLVCVLNICRYLHLVCLFQFLHASCTVFTCQLGLSVLVSACILTCLHSGLQLLGPWDADCLRCCTGSCPSSAACCILQLSCSCSNACQPHFSDKGVLLLAMPTAWHFLWLCSH